MLHSVLGESFENLSCKNVIIRYPKTFALFLFAFLLEVSIQLYQEHLILSGNMTGEDVSMDDIIDDFFVFCVAGMETTAITMSILVWLLLKHPEISRKVVTEVYSSLIQGFCEYIGSVCTCLRMLAQIFRPH